jgi:8-oxo-dGTP pyrophosphatase MutT (NUDIX family)
MSVLFTRRSDTLASHPGQISFPGGQIDNHDTDAIHTALREAEEEVGIGRGLVTIAGTLSRYRTGTGFEITPVVGFVSGKAELRPNSDEVAAIFEVPLPYLLERRNYRRIQQRHGLVSAWFHQIEFPPHTIWGATAAILVNLRKRVARVGANGTETAAI